MSGIGSMISLMSIAMPVYNELIAPNFDGGSVSERPSVWDAWYLTAAVSSVSEIINDVKALPKSFSHLLGFQRHHVIPKYMCGSNSQGQVRLSWPDHALLHWQLDMLAKILAKTGDRLAIVLKARSMGKISIEKIGKRKLGRIAISSALKLFYQEFDWLDKGLVSNVPGDHPTIEQGWNKESPLFVEGKTSCR